MSFKNYITLSNFTLLVALTLSTVAAYYSIYGLTAIFAGAVIPVVIMGTILEIGKVTTTVWLKKYWNKCHWTLKSYLVPAVVLLAFITSMGIFGFLSKAHMEHGINSGDAQTKLAIFDEKIKTEKDSIEYARKALAQMDDQVNARLSRGDSENGAERAVQIRRQQANERNKLLKEIQEAQQKIQILNEQRAPIAAENRKIEAEVGPIKYVAALIYGDNPDSNLLERAVRYVIILLVMVFDPLAIMLVLAGNSSKEWDKLEKQDSIEKTDVSVDQNLDVSVDQNLKDQNTIIIEDKVNKYEEFTSEEQVLAFVDAASKELMEDIQDDENRITHEYLENEWVHIPSGEPMVLDISLKEEQENTDIESIENENPVVEETLRINYITVDNIDKTLDCLDTNIYEGEIIQEEQPVIVEQEVETPAVNLEVTDTKTIELSSTQIDLQTENVTTEKLLKDLDDGYVLFENKHYSKQAFKELFPVFLLNDDNDYRISTSFGTQFPNTAHIGDIFVRVDSLPNRVFKFDGKRWIELNKTNSDSYLHNEAYIQYLIEKLEKLEYDPELLTENEKVEIETYLKNQDN
jgi:hypothetical protein